MQRTLSRHRLSHLGPRQRTALTDRQDQRATGGRSPLAHVPDHRVDFRAIAPGADVIQRSVMRNPRRRSGMVALALAFTVSACGGSSATINSPVTIKTLDPNSQGGC
ncbi:MAG: hypothetical protein QG587_934, partial [Chloroflexota bacterium]|nr:hypothetical protein [Chloroflexota bacterium]